MRPTLSLVSSLLPFPSTDCADPAGTGTIWDYMNSPPPPEKYINPDHNPTLDDPTSRCALPEHERRAFLARAYSRGDEEMKGHYAATAAPVSTPSRQERQRGPAVRYSFTRLIIPLSAPSSSYSSAVRVYTGRLRAHASLNSLSSFSPSPPSLRS
ncbi:hypothetical protein BJV74DRAFT_792987 [Russula compacta]|nr:hypothetical protein BJV74DRAFT_792987 [Russula compacta]